MGQARKYILNCDYIRTSGVTTTGGTDTYDLRNAFSGNSVFDSSGTSFSYSAVTTIDIATMSNSEYTQRVEDFLSYVSVHEYTATLSGLTALTATAQYISVFCIDPTTTTTTSTSTTSTTLAPVGTTTSTTTTTSTSTTSTSTTTSTTTTLPPVVTETLTLGFNAFCFGGNKHCCFTTSLSGPLPMNMCVAQANVDGFNASCAGVASSHMCTSSITYPIGHAGGCCVAPFCTTGDWFCPTNPAIYYVYVAGLPFICFPGSTPSSWVPSGCGTSHLFCCGANCVCLTVNFPVTYTPI